MSRGSTDFEIFGTGPPPVETDTGVHCGSRRRMGESNIFPAAKYRHDSARGSRRSKSPAPIPDQAVFCDRPACRATVCAISFSEEPDGKEDRPFLNSLLTSAFVSRETHAHPKFLACRLLTRI